MGRFITNVPNLKHFLNVGPVKLLPWVSEVGFRGGKLKAEIKDGLTREEYEELAKQVRLVYAFAYRTVYSESYQISTPKSGFHYTGRDDRKAHLLARVVTQTPKFLQSSDHILEDLLTSPAPKKPMTKQFNLLYVWTRAQELQQLNLPLEAQLLMGEIVDDMKRDGLALKPGKLVKGLGVIKTESDQFAARVLLANGRDKLPSANDELEGFSYLYRLRQRQAELVDNETKFYLGKQVQSDIEKKNNFLFEMCRLYILWEFGLGNYCLKQNASLYKLERKANRGQ